MRKPNSNKVILTFSIALCLLVLSTQKSSAQTMCTKAGTDQVTGVQDGYRYELWNQNAQGTACMTLGSGALFSGEWSGVENYLARRGLGYDRTQKHQEIGTFYSVYDCKYNPSSASGNSYLSIYGWTVNPLIEFYIIEDWRNWIPSMSNSAKRKGSIAVNGGTYDIYENTRVNQPSIQGNTTFQQYFSIRRDKRDSGTINISEHFAAWEALGMDMGNMYEVSFVVEGYKSSGSFEFTSLEIMTGDDATSRTDELKEDPYIKILSEPNSGKLSIVLGESALNSNMKIYDVSGQLVFFKDSITINQLNVSNLKSGIYFVNVRNNKINYSTRFLIY